MSDQHAEREAPHVRMLKSFGPVQDTTVYVSSCTCGWGGKAYQTKRDAAAAWGHHAAASRRSTKAQHNDGSGTLRSRQEHSDG